MAREHNCGLIARTGPKGPHAHWTMMAQSLVCHPAPPVQMSDAITSSMVLLALYAAGAYCKPPYCAQVPGMIW
jgi:hypothetical protein